MPKGTADPQRPLRIALAALQVVADQGVEGLTHRAVAKVAGVPLGSTTYHFATLDDLLQAAIVEAKKATDLELQAWAQTLDRHTDLAAAVVDYVMDTLGHHWNRMIVEHELYMASLRRPQLRGTSREWDEAFPAVLAQHTDPATALTTALVVDGLFIRAVIHGMPLRHDVEAVVRPLLG